MLCDKVSRKSVQERRRKNVWKKIDAKYNDRSLLRRERPLKNRQRLGPWSPNPLLRRIPLGLLPSIPLYVTCYPDRCVTYTRFASPEKISLVSPSRLTSDHSADKCDDWSVYRTNHVHLRRFILQLFLSFFLPDVRCRYWNLPLTITAGFYLLRCCILLMQVFSEQHGPIGWHWSLFL